MLEAESTRQPGEPDNATSMSAPYPPDQDAVAGQEVAEQIPDAPHVTHKSRESKQLLSRNQDKAHKRRRLRALRKRIVAPGA